MLTRLGLKLLFSPSALETPGLVDVVQTLFPGTRNWPEKIFLKPCSAQPQTCWKPWSHPRCRSVKETALQLASMLGAIICHPTRLHPNGRCLMLWTMVPKYTVTHPELGGTVSYPRYHTAPHAHLVLNKCLLLRMVVIPMELLFIV